MRLLMITVLSEVGAEFADELCTNGSVTVLHPGIWPIESKFQERSIEPQDLLTVDLSQYESVVYLASNELEIDYLEYLMERLRSSFTPCICIEPRMISVRGDVPVSAEQSLCRFYQEKYSVPISWLSVPALYGNDFLPDEWTEKLLKCSKNNSIELQGELDDECDLLHVSDAALLIRCMIDDNEHPKHITVGSGYVSDLGNVVRVFRGHFQLADIHLSKACGTAVHVCVNDYSKWMPNHSFIQELPNVLREMENQGSFERLQHKNVWMRRLERLIAFVLLFVCVCLYTGFIRVSSELQFVDVRLLFVIGVSLYMGRGYGMAASICSSVASIAEAIAVGNRWHTIFFHIDNWIPIAVYIAVAVLFGMYSENHCVKDGEENDL